MVRKVIKEHTSQRMATLFVFTQRIFTLLKTVGSVPSDQRLTLPRSTGTQKPGLEELSQLQCTSHWGYGNSTVAAPLNNGQEMPVGPVQVKGRDMWTCASCVYVGGGG